MTVLPTPFNLLTPAGQLRRFHQAAGQVLKNYDLGPTQHHLLSRSTNLIYQVSGVDGRQHALRLSNPQWRSRQNLRAEAAWLTALGQSTDISAPEILVAINGQPVQSVSVNGLEGERLAVLMTWVPGRSLGHYLTAANLEKMGELFSRLHLQSGVWKAPAGFNTQAFTQFLGRGEPDMLTQDAIEAFPEAAGVLQQARARVESVYTGLDRRDLRVIHCDLWHDNIRLHRGQLYPFDFEDTIYGFRLHDMAMALLDLMEVVDVDTYNLLYGAFRQGYETRMGWPDGDLEALQIGRLLWKANFVKRYQSGRFADHLVSIVPVFKAWLGGTPLSSCLAQNSSEH
jgi:Ser/Thr protein kinase RdoA (MazF antagonist)